jgi:hypothetical protein
MLIKFQPKRVEQGEPVTTIQIPTGATEDHNPREVIGGNFPPAPIEPAVPAISPTCIDTARGVYRSLAAFLAETPVIETPEDAKKGASLIEQVRATLGEMKDEHDELVKPLNVKLKAIHDLYRVPREAITLIVDKLKHRLSVYANAEEARRKKIAEEARLAAIEAERLAREAEAREREAIADADVGVAGIDVAGSIIQADRTFSSFKAATRNAVRAEREIPLRLNGGFGRAVGLRKSETLKVDDAIAAIKAMGLTEKIADAILSSARAYRALPVIRAGSFARKPRGVSFRGCRCMSILILGLTNYKRKHRRGSLQS